MTTSPRLGKVFTARVARTLARAEIDELGQYPVTKDQFEEGFAAGIDGVADLGDDDTDRLISYGHVNPDVMAARVNELGTVSPCAAADVAHFWALCPVWPQSEGWYIEWDDRFTAANSNAFPVTVVERPHAA